MSSTSTTDSVPRPLFIKRVPTRVAEDAIVGIVDDIAVLCVRPGKKVTVRRGRRKIVVHGDYRLISLGEQCVCIGDFIELDQQVFEVKGVESAQRSLSAHQSKDGRFWSWLVQTNQRIIALVRRSKELISLASAVFIVIAVRLAQLGKFNDFLGLVLAVLTVLSATYVFVGRQIWKHMSTPVGEIPKAPGARLIAMMKARPRFDFSNLRQLLPKEVSELSQVDIRTWDFASDRRDIEFYNRFNGACFRSNPQSLLMIDVPTLRDNRNSSLGYTSVIPLTPDAYQRFRSGEIIDGDLNDGLIDHQEKGFKYVLASVMFIECPYREMFPLLGPKALLYHLALMYHGNPDEDFYILMNPVNTKLQRIFSKHDMPFVLDNRDGQRLFEVNLRSYQHLSENVRAFCDYIIELNKTCRS